MVLTALGDRLRHGYAIAREGESAKTSVGRLEATEVLVVVIATRRLHGQCATDFADLVARKGKVRLAFFEGDINKEARRPLAFKRANDVVLGRERDENVINLVVDTQIAHCPHFGTHHFGVARRRHIQIERSAPGLTQAHTTFQINDRRPDCAGELHDCSQGVIQTCHTIPIPFCPGVFHRWT